MLETIYITRHGFRSNWVVSNTGEYTASIKSPTGIPNDPPLASHGVTQARELAAYLPTVSPPVERIYSSPYYRCLQTIDPVAEKLGLGIAGVEGGIAEWFGIAPFDHPSPATPEFLKTLFPRLDDTHSQIVIPAIRGESMAAVHDRAAFTLSRFVADLDAEPNGPKAILLCTHAATNIALGRALVGDEVFDVKTGTCSLGVYRRKGPGKKDETTYDRPYDINKGAVPRLDWRDGNGVGGGWECLKNGDCSFLKNGEERNWWFGGDEAWDFPVAAGTASAGTKTGADGGDAMGKDSGSKI